MFTLHEVEARKASQWRLFTIFTIITIVLHFLNRPTIEVYADGSHLHNQQQPSSQNLKTECKTNPYKRRLDFCLQHKKFRGKLWWHLVSLGEGHLFRQGSHTEVPCLPHTISSKCMCTFWHANLKLPNPERQNFFDHQLSCNPQKLTLRPPVQRTPQWKTTWKLIRFSSLWISGRKCHEQFLLIWQMRKTLTKSHPHYHGSKISPTGLEENWVQNWQKNGIHGKCKNSAAENNCQRNWKRRRKNPQYLLGVKWSILP